jgi:hypothetical protein
LNVIQGNAAQEQTPPQAPAPEPAPAVETQTPPMEAPKAAPEPEKPSKPAKPSKEGMKTPSDKRILEELKLQLRVIEQDKARMDALKEVLRKYKPTRASTIEEAMLNLSKQVDRASGNPRKREETQRDLQRASELFGFVEAKPRPKPKPAQELKLETNSQREERQRKEREARAANRPPSLVKELNKKLIEKGFSAQEKETIAKNLESAADKMNDQEKESSIASILFGGDEKMPQEAAWVDRYIERYQVARHPDASPERDLAREELQEANRILGIRSSKDLLDANFKPEAKPTAPAESPLNKPLNIEKGQKKRNKRG